MKRFFVLIFCLAFSASAQAQDWSQWRGPNRDGVVATFKSPKNWPEKLKLNWKVTVGTGPSSPVLAGNRVYLLSRQDKQEVISSYDLKSGKQIWRHRYTTATDYSIHESATTYGRSPRATPLVHQDRVFTLGVTGRITCLDAQTGKLLWKKDATDHDSKSYPLFGFAPSPLIFDRSVIIATGGERQGGLTAFDAETGKVKWEWRGEYQTPHDGVGYSSPVLMQNNGATHLVVVIDRGVVGLSPQDGKLLWRFPFSMTDQASVTTPVIHNDQVIISERSRGLMAVRVSKRGTEWEARQVWQNRGFFNYTSSPVAQDGLLFGMSYRNKGQYFCADLMTGQTLWRTEGRQGESAAVLVGRNELFVQTVDGELIMARKSREKFDILKRYKVADSATWAHPVLFDKYLLVKDANSLLLWSLS